MINNVSKKIAFSALKMIKYGKIIVTDYDDRKYVFGDDESLVVIVKINKSDFFVFQFRSLFFTHSSS